MLDLGTGTGFVVEALKQDFSEIVGVDADPDMLAAARGDVVPLPDQDIAWVCARAEEFVPDPGWQPDLVTMARAFHWFDQKRLLANLDRFVAPQGTLAIMGDQSVWTSSQDWKVAVRRLIQAFLGEPRRAGDGVKHHDERPFRDILTESAFADVEERSVPTVRERDIRSVVGYVHSTSFAAARLFGGRLAEFDTAMVKLLGDYASKGVLRDENEFSILLARRTQGASRRG